MAPPRKHETDVILDATRALVLAGGPRAAGVAAIAKASGAPAGTLYHRFGNRDGVLVATWLRALERFQVRAMAATGDTAVDAAVAMGVAALGFARDEPEDARLLLSLRPADLVDGAPDAAFGDTLAAMNAPLAARVCAAGRNASTAPPTRGPSTPSPAPSSTCPTRWCAGMPPTAGCRGGSRRMSRRRSGLCSSRASAHDGRHDRVQSRQRQPGHRGTRRGTLRVDRRPRAAAPLGRQRQPVRSARRATGACGRRRVLDDPHAAGGAGEPRRRIRGGPADRVDARRAGWRTDRAAVAVGARAPGSTTRKPASRTPTTGRNSTTRNASSARAARPRSRWAAHWPGSRTSPKRTDRRKRPSRWHPRASPGIVTGLG